jgi:arginine:ornithine antiporter / lysine permease
MAAQMPVTQGKFSLPMLSAIVVGSMIGGGIFTLPHSFARVTGPVGALIAWTLAGSGMFALARVLQFLAVRKPHLYGGIYAYAKAGFGDYVGFLAVFGYWLSGCMGSTTYWVLVKATLGGFFPVFGDGGTPAAILVASVGIWAFHWLILRGVPRAATINTVTTIAKVTPIVAFIVLVAAAFDGRTFRANLAAGVEGASLAAQVRDTLFVTLYTFLGIEGASIYSRYAKKRSDVGRATLLGLTVVTSLMVLTTLLPYAVLDRAALAQMRQPSMASVLEAVVGRWGAAFISIALIVSVMGAYLAWMMICAEVLFIAAHSGDMPKVFKRENKIHTPTTSLWVTNAVVQFMVLTTYWSKDPYYMMLRFTSEMSVVPYLLVALFGLMIVWRGETYGMRPFGRSRDLVMAACASVFSLILVAAGGVRVILISAIFYTLGTALYVWARREQGLRVFKLREWAVFALAVLGGAYAVHSLASGGIPVDRISPR